MDAGYFITGTDTDCGKTLVTLGLMQLLQSEGFSVIGMKPVASGSDLTSAGLRNGDALQLLNQSTVRSDYESINPYAFSPAIAPHLAAEYSGQEIEIRVIQTCYSRLSLTADKILVEGVGGWYVPLSGHSLLADLPAALALPVILVVGMRLGCINHALLTVDAINASASDLVGWVANTVDPSMLEFEGNLQTLKQRITAPLLGVVPYLERPIPPELAKHLSLPISGGGSAKGL